MSYADLTPQQKRDTEPWILTAPDKAAVEEGMWWDLESAAYNIWWIERFCKLYEGAGFAGKPLYIHGYHDQPEPVYIADFYADLDYTLDVFRERFKDYYRKRSERDHVGWQLDFQARCYGWRTRSERWARQGIPEVRRFKSGTVFIPKKSGKMLDVDTLIPTPDGWKRNGDLEAGDLVFDKDGVPCEVRIAHPISIPEEAFEVTFSNGQTVKACGDHLWSVESLRPQQDGRFSGVDTSNKTGSYYDYVCTTREMFDGGLKYGSANAYRVQLHEGLQDLPEQDLPLHPYVLGLWLGDGSKDRMGFTSHADDFPHMKASLMDCEELSVRTQRNDTGTVISATFDDRWNVALREKPLSASLGNRILREAGFLRNKHIPQNYLRASREQRIALLQGLMDTDGTVDKKGKGLSFSNTNEKIILGMKELLASLGIKYSCRKKVTQWDYKGVRKNGSAWEIRFCVFRDHLEAFRLPRKLARQLYSDHGVMGSNRSRTVHIVDIQPCGPVEMRCITVDSPSSTYLFGGTMLPTHNSPTMAANVVYITCGDGEPGNKCFIGAGNQDQAGIAWKHAYLMIQQSDELKKEFKPNMSTKRVEHMPSNSTFEPMSSANQRSQNAKEGLNGSCCLDEIHVLDEEFVSILRYMGVSRPEPLQLEFSTAGKNPEAYGATRWKYGERLNAGEEHNLHHLHISYNAPQNLSAEELAKDPEKYITLANPSLGHTVDMEELLPSYHAVKNDARELRRYMMYRLNIFQNATSSWLDPGVWAECGGKPFSEAQLQNRSCVVGLDLARRHDLACAVFCWLGEQEEDDQPILIRPYFWCPETIVRDRASKIPEFTDWALEGYIKATPGNVIDFRVIEKDLRDLMLRYDVKGMTYDATYAEDLVQRITEGVVGPDGGFVYEPVAIGEKAVSQSILTMTGMTTDFENDLKSGRVRHENHPVLTWQIGNASVKEDNKGNIQVVKENRDSFRTVDGVVAAIMGRWGLVDCEDFDIQSLDYYVNNDVEFV